jgi:CHAT domain-containing protein
MVVMSACETGLGKAFQSGVIGLAKAWKYAGASPIVMTLWSVYDAPTRDLMVDFLFRVNSGNAPDQALRAAMLKTRTNPNTYHPVYWAGFAIYGGPSH